MSNEEGDTIYRGERGPQGDKGGHGQTGDIGLTGRKGEKGDRGEDNPRSRVFRGLVIAWIVVFTITVGYLLREDRHHDAELQQGRLQSCQQTYQGFIHVLQPLFPPREEWTPRQLEIWDTLNETVDRLQMGCAEQIKPD